MKRKITITVIGLFCWFNTTAQDGSDITYYNPEQIDSTFIGKFCHVDFGEISFGGKNIDTIQIYVKGQLLKFYEHRQDNGFYNWFHQQHLVQVGEYSSTRLQYSQIDSITSDKLYVTSILGYYSPEGSPIDTITVFQHWYDRKNIAKVLIKN